MVPNGVNCLNARGTSILLDDSNFIIINLKLVVRVGIKGEEMLVLRKILRTY